MDADVAVRVSGSDKRMSRGGFETAAKPSALLMPPTGKVEPNTPLSDFDASGTDFLGLRMRRGRSDVDDPVGAAGDCEGMRTNRGHVFVEPRSPVGECRKDIRSNRNDLFRGLSDQVDEKRCRVFRRSYRDLRINVFRDLFDGEEYLNVYGDDVARIPQGNFIGGDLKAVRVLLARPSSEADRSRSDQSG